jgi:putative ABC transport system permease protein
MAVAERQREIGVLRALGASRVWVCGLVGREAVCITVIGAFLGLCVARVASGMLESWLRSRMPFTPAGSIADLDLFSAAASTGVAVLIGLLASLPAVLSASRMPPACAIRAGDAVC